MDVQAVTSDIQKLLQDLSFPAGKNDIVQHAQEQGASSETTTALQKLPQQQFGSVGEIIQKLPMNEIEGEIGKYL